MNKAREVADRIRQEASEKGESAREIYKKTLKAGPSRFIVMQNEDVEYVQDNPEEVEEEL